MKPIENQEKKNEPKKVKLDGVHSKKYIKMLKETTYKDKEVVFILHNGKEYKEDGK